MRPEEADALDELLREWASAEAGRYVVAANDDRPARDSHPIARSIPFAPKTRLRAALRLAGRDGRGRRKLMALKTGVKGLRILPQHAVDPIRCKETRHNGPIVAAVDAGIPPALRKVSQAALELYRMDTLQGLVLRFEYCGQGRQSDKAVEVGRALGAPVTLRTYRDQLRLARQWMAGKLAA